MFSITESIKKQIQINIKNGLDISELIKNPIYAAAEEVFICVLLYLLAGAYPFVSIILK